MDYFNNVLKLIIIDFTYNVSLNLYMYSNMKLTL